MKTVQGMSGNRRASAVIVEPESRKMAAFSSIRARALRAICCFFSIFWPKRCSSGASEPWMVSSERAPAWMRTIFRASSRLLRSLRSVISETSGNMLISVEKLTVPFLLTISTILALRSSSMSNSPCASFDSTSHLCFILKPFLLNVNIFRKKGPDGGAARMASPARQNVTKKRTKQAMTCKTAQRTI